MIEPDATLAVLLIAHGSRRPEANDDLFELAARLERDGNTAIVEPSFLELATPDILRGGARCVARGAQRVLLVPYFLSAGIHLARDLANARRELAERFPEVRFTLGPALGPHRLLDELVRQRIADTMTLESDHPPGVRSRIDAPPSHD